MIVVTQKNGPAYPGRTPFRVHLVEAIREWSGYDPQVQLLKLKIRTICLTDASPDPRSEAMLTVRGVGTYETLSEQEIKNAFVAQTNIDMMDRKMK